MRFDPIFVPFLLTSAVYVAGGLLALTPVVDQSVSVTFVAITVYISLTTIFFALVVPTRLLSEWRRYAPAIFSLRFSRPCSG